MNISLLQKSCVKALCKQLNHTSITQMTRLLKNAFSFITSKGSLDAALPDGKHIFFRNPSHEDFDSSTYQQSWQLPLVLFE